jgi:hypothetical protein
MLIWTHMDAIFLKTVSRGDNWVYLPQQVELIFGGVTCDQITIICIGALLPNVKVSVSEMNACVGRNISRYWEQSYAFISFSARTVCGCFGPGVGRKCSGLKVDQSVVKNGEGFSFRPTNLQLSDAKVRAAALNIFIYRKEV